MKVVNLLGTPCNVAGRVYMPDKEIASVHLFDGRWTDVQGLPVYREKRTGVKGVPFPSRKDGDFAAVYIVDSLVLRAMDFRKDLFTPNTWTINKNGHIECSHLVGTWMPNEGERYQVPAEEEEEMVVFVKEQFSEFGETEMEAVPSKEDALDFVVRLLAMPKSSVEPLVHQAWKNTGLPVWATHRGLTHTITIDYATEF